jgi:beta-glucosidase
MMKLPETGITAVMLVLFSFLVGAQDKPSHEVPPYLNSKLPVQQRVEDLLKRMTLEEKVGQLNQYVAPQYAAASAPEAVSSRLQVLLKNGLVGSFLFVQDAKEANELQKIAENTRLKIPLIFGIDAVHGLCPVRGTTIFPSPIGMASTWDPTLIQQVAAITARETRATGMHWTFAPILDVARDPRWGRTAETLGEDPFLVSELGRAMVKGFQGDDLSSPESVLACAKHFGAHSQPLGGRNTAPVDISERTLHTVFLPPFQAAIEAGAASVMAAYHDLNGVPCHASEQLLTHVLRAEWGFKGFVVSDWGGIEMLVDPHHVAGSHTEAVRQALVAGIDMHMEGDGFTEPVLDLVRRGIIPETRIDQSVSRILTAKFCLGLFENRIVDLQTVPRILANEEHRAKDLEVARKSIVLLRNEKALLPLKKNLKSILVTGPMANNNALLGDWTAPQPPGHVTKILGGIQAKVHAQTQVQYVDCGDVWNITPQRIQQAVQAAKLSDVAIVVVGENETRYDEQGNFNRERKERTGGEGVDRADLNLVGAQLDLVKAVYATGTPTVVVLINGRPQSIAWIAENVPAILEAWEPGMEGGKAVADILFGDTNPSGKLPISIPRSVGQLPVWYNHQPSAEGDYRFMSSRPLYSFGYGLSYTQFEYNNLKIPEKIAPGEAIDVSVEIRNAGSRSGDEVAMLFIHDLVSSIVAPVKELKAFTRITLKAGETQTVHFRLAFDELALYDRSMKKVVEPGKFAVMVGNLSKEFEVPSQR